MPILCVFGVILHWHIVCIVEGLALLACDERLREAKAQVYTMYLIRLLSRTAVALRLVAKKPANGTNPVELRKGVWLRFAYDNPGSKAGGWILVCESQAQAEEILGVVTAILG